jgi:DNA-directed RNA polymerase specialized sigma24 family protein
MIDRHVANGSGSVSWVRERLLALCGDEQWATRREGRELVEWIHVTVQRRARKLGLSPDASDEVAQDAMARVVRALATSRATYATAINPAAIVERVAARAVAESRHRVMMAGFGGVAANGQNWRARFPRQIGGDAARQLFEELPVPDPVADTSVLDAADRIGEWVVDRVGVRLTATGKHAVVYVLDRLVAGVGRPSLLRGGHSALGSDPAMRYLGFDGTASRAFALWLLGRCDADHRTPSVLDAALLGQDVDALTAERWGRDGIRFGFVHDLDAIAA